MIYADDMFIKKGVNLSPKHRMLGETFYLLNYDTRSEKLRIHEKKYFASCH